MDPDHPEAKKMVFKQLIVWDRSGYRSQRVLVSKRLSFTGMAENWNAKLSHTVMQIQLVLRKLDVNPRHPDFNALQYVPLQRIFIDCIYQLHVVRCLVPT